MQTEKVAAPLPRKFANAIWLLPAAPARTFFRGLVARLAAQYDAPVFQPHLTVGLGSPGMPDTITGKPLQLRVLGVYCSAQFTETLFVRLEPCPELTVLRQSLGVHARGFDPHLSLLYKKLPMVTKRQLAASIRLPFSTVTFDAVQIVHCPSPTTTRRDVESWKILASRRLEAAS